jgi:hypothetical protein
MASSSGHLLRNRRFFRRVIMLPRVRIISPLFPALAVVLVLLGSLPASSRTLVEDFTTLTYADTLNTSALWNTTSGTLELPPFELTVVGSLSVGDVANAIDVEGDYAYLGRGPQGFGGFEIVNIQDPMNPVVLGSLAVQSVTDLERAGRHVFVAEYDYGLRVVDIYIPTAPALAGSAAAAGLCNGLAVAGDHVYMSEDTRLEVFDISTPTSPILVGTLLLPAEGRGIALAGDRAYIAGGSAGLHVVDIQDPTSPTLDTTLVTTAPALHVTPVGNYAYVAETTTVEVVDILDPLNPSIVANLGVGSGGRVDVTGNYAHVPASSPDRIEVFDISDPSSPTAFGAVALSAAAGEVFLAGDHAYVAIGGGLAAIRIAELPPLKLAGSLSLSGYVQKVAVEGDYAFVSAGPLHVVDIRDPSNPLLVTTYGVTSAAYGLAPQGDLLYVADQGGALRVIDVSDPTNPQSVGSSSGYINAQDVFVDGNLAYVAAFMGGLLVFDISNPANPTLAGSYEPYEGVYRVFVSGNLAYLTGGPDYQCTIVDVTNPASVSRVGGWSAGPTSTNDMWVAGDHAFPPPGSTGDFFVIDVSNPASPVTAGSVSGCYQGLAIFVAGNHVFTSSQSRLSVIDIADPTSPAVVHDHTVPDVGLDVVVDGDHAFIADKTSLQVLEVYQRRFDREGNVGQSLPVSNVAADVVAVRLCTAQTATVDWEISADNGANWQSIQPDSSWVSVTTPGQELIWRSTHTYSLAGVNASVSQLVLDYLFEPGVILAVEDVPGDQGGQISLTWEHSVYDTVGSATPITSYEVYRRIDSSAAAAAKQRFLDETGRGRGLPSQIMMPGWHYLMSVPAHGDSAYSIVAPTLADSTISGGMQWSVFLVRAATADPYTFWDSPPDSGYSVDNLAPSVPASLQLAYTSLSWDECPDADFDYFTVYGSDTGDIGEAVLIGYTVEPSMDVQASPFAWYHVTATDFAGNQGQDAAVQNAALAVGAVRAVPTQYDLHAASPSPFVEWTAIAFDVPGAGRATLRIYDVAGRHVRTLVDRFVEPGRHLLTWNGRDSSGRAVSAGVYLARFDAGNFSATQKLVKLK